MEKRPEKHAKQNESGAKSVGGVNILTNGESGVYLDGAEKVIEMYENGDLSQQDLYNSIMDLEVVFKTGEGKMS
jgi:hypothetical protein